MKILGRILVILMAALVIVGITFALVGSNTAAAAGRSQGNSAAQVQAAGGSSATSVQGENVDFRGGHERGNGGSMGLFGLVEVGKNLAIIAVIVALVAPLSNVLRRRAARL